LVGGLALDGFTLLAFAAGAYPGHKSRIATAFTFKRGVLLNEIFFLNASDSGMTASTVPPIFILFSIELPIGSSAKEIDEPLWAAAD
jgi:hypothetical protein